MAEAIRKEPQVASSIDTPLQARISYPVKIAMTPKVLIHVEKKDLSEQEKLKRQATEEQERLNTKALESILDSMFDGEVVTEEVASYPFKEPTKYVSSRKELEYSPASAPLPTLGESGSDEYDPESEVFPEADKRTYVYEDKLDKLFWFSTKRAIFVVGEPGCGKSTFMKYYLKGYCRHREDDRITDPDFKIAFDRKQKFKQKLIIHVSLEGKDREAVKEAFYKEAKRVIRESFTSRVKDMKVNGLLPSDLPSYEENIEYSDMCAMFEPRFRWTEDADDHECLREGKPLDLYRRAQVRNRNVERAEEWFDYARTFLDARPQYFRYMVLVFDNLDRSNVEVQVPALEFAVNEVLGNKKEWRLFVPVWPSTIGHIRNSLRNVISPTMSEDFDLPPVDWKEYYARRLRKDASAEASKEAGPEGEAFEAALRRAQTYVNHFHTKGSYGFFRFVNNLSGGNLRFRRYLVRSALLNPTLRRRIEEGKAGGLYWMYCALLEGECGRNCSQHHSPVGNMFVASKESGDKYRRYFLGFHLLWMLLHPRAQLRYPQLRRELTSLGYLDTEITSSLENFQEWNLLEFAPATADRPVDAHAHAVTSYWRLIGEAAYLDSMALATPVPDTTLAKMYETKADLESEDDYYKRKMSTIEFLNYLRQAEDNYTKFIESQEDARRLIGELKIPSLFRTLANSYRSALERESTMPTLKTYTLRSKQLLDKLSEYEKPALRWAQIASAK